MDECSLRLAQFLAGKYAVTVHSMYADGRSDADSGPQIVPVSAVGRPALLRVLSYLWVAEWRRRRLVSNTFTIATGATAFGADLNICHFCHAGWRGQRLEKGPYRRLFTEANVILERRALRTARLVIAVSESVRDQLETLVGVEAPRIRVIGHGVDSSRFAPGTGSRKVIDRRSFGLPDRAFVVATVGDFVRGMKRLELVAEAAARLGPSACLLVVGKVAAERRTYCERVLGPRVRFAGVVRDVERSYRAADAFVLLSAYEPFGLVVLEAMASALPVLVSASVGSAAHVARARCGAVLQAPVTTEGAADVLRRWQARPGLRRELGRRARRAARRLSWDAVLEQYADTIKLLAS